MIPFFFSPFSKHVSSLNSSSAAAVSFSFSLLSEGAQTTPHISKRVAPRSRRDLHLDHHEVIATPYHLSEPDV